MGRKLTGSGERVGGGGVVVDCGEVRWGGWRGWWGMLAVLLVLGLIF